MTRVFILSIIINVFGKTGIHSSLKKEDNDIPISVDLDLGFVIAFILFI